MRRPPLPTPRTGTCAAAIPLAVLDPHGMTAPFPHHTSRQVVREIVGSLVEHDALLVLGKGLGAFEITVAATPLHMHLRDAPRGVSRV